MKPLSSYFAVFSIAFLFSLTYSAADNNQENFVQCLQNYIQYKNSTSISNITYTQTNSSYLSILNFSAQNLRFRTNTTQKPLVIVTPLEVSHIQATIFCAQRHDLQIRTRSGGHDYEGLSYAARSNVPFLVLDLINFREIEVDVENRTAWAQAGATNGELYYEISQKSNGTLGFPAGICPTVGLGGHIGGGGYGYLSRKYGLSIDNVIDANIVDVKGRLLNRKSMGEDLFWAIRGGGGASFGVITSWKIKLVPLPSNVTVFRVSRTLEQNATQLIQKWQLLSNTIDDDLLIRVNLVKVNSSQTSNNLTISANFESLFLGGINELIPLMEEKFPELGLVREDCDEMSWIESVHNLAGFTSDQPLDALLNRTQSGLAFFKSKSDYVQEPIPDNGLEGIYQFLYENVSAQQIVVFNPYGGKIDEVSESETPFPHRAGNIYSIQYFAIWTDEGDEVAEKNIDWIRRLYNYTAAFVSKSPRSAYVNERDLDIGANNNTGSTSYQQASVWGFKYFKNNFERLAEVKTIVDPLNFFRFEQSIPSLLPLGLNSLDLLENKWSS